MNKEQHLVKRILSGDEQAINEFYQQFKSRLRYFIAKKADPAVTEEILQETFISALKSLPSYKAKSKLFSWLCSIAWHETCDYYRKKKIKSIVFSRLPFLEGLVSRALSPELAMEEKELKQKITLTLRGLSEGYSQILRLKYHEGLSMVQIAAKLKITVKAVESRLSRARKAFKYEFKKPEKVSGEISKIWLAAWD
ncbi:RNA polymerase sigma factor [Patescibacteria group bacterium]|nr:RNA polymerase sigma factor [Patescibacteria group bacterium]MBU1931491.1 RNA polymerase sigma factor [Patescibacteria group bacterium]